MKARYSFIFTTIILSFVALSWSVSNIEDSPKWDENTPLYTVLNQLGEPLPKHAKENASEEVLKRGYDLVYKGRTIGPDGKQSKYISKYYMCTSCHNQKQENPNVGVLDPEARLDYAVKNNQKFLPGTGFYGIANREVWYNDDYYNKYGDLVKPARESLAEATQLCATVCSSGRYLEDWELEAILAYYWNNQIKLGDLKLSETEWEKLRSSASASKQELVQMLKSKYALKSPATFGELPKSMYDGYPHEGNAERGKQIYELACMACHQPEGVSDISFVSTSLVAKKFMRNLYSKGDYNLYHIIRHGTYAGQGKPRYMPLYPKERMSDQQIEDLRAYLKQEAS